MTASQTPGRGSPPGDVNPAGRSQQPRPGTTTPSDEAILRSWLGGNNITAIAKARRTTQDVVARTIDDLCRFDRGHARRVLATGARLPLPNPTPTPAAPPTAWTAALADAEQSAARLAALVEDLRRQLAAAQVELERRPVPLADYGALWCRPCRQVVATGHRHPAEAVTVAVLTRTAAPVTPMEAA